MLTLLSRTIVIVVFAPNPPSSLVPVLVDMPLSSEVISVIVPGRCRSQGCHGYLLRSLAVPFCFMRHLPHTHLLLMGLNGTYCFWTGTHEFSQEESQDAP